MIYQRLTQDHSAGRLYNSYLVSTNDVNDALEQIYNFLVEKIFCEEEAPSADKLQKYTHPDLFLCTKEDVKAKNITVEQVRKLREFIQKSSVISGYKVAIITPADLMNDNAANSCLKILEDTPGHSLIILLTSMPAALLQTIRSRCARISCHVEDQGVIINNDYQKFLEIFSEDSGFESQNSLIKEFSGKDRSRWIDFAVKLEELLCKFIKIRSGVTIDLIAYERAIYNKFISLSTAKIEYRHKQLSLLIQDVVKYDLDLKMSAILLLDYFTQAD